MTTPEDFGWGAPCDTNTLTTVTSAGIRWTVRKEMAPIVVAFVQHWHESVEPLDSAQCWSFACRNIRGSTSPSFHSWGLALDLNAQKHPLGKRGTFSRDQETAIRELCQRYGFRWGGDFDDRADEMHVEVAVTPTTAAKIAATLEDNDMTPEQAQMLADIAGGMRVLTKQRNPDGSDPDPAHPSVPDLYKLVGELGRKVDSLSDEVRASRSGG
jgi:hypothetical protein